MTKFLGTALLAAICAMSNQVSAAPVALNGSIGSNALSNGTYEATFSGTSFLPANYLINSLAYSFTFRDDASDSWTVGEPKHDKTTTTGYTYESGIFNYTYSRDVDIYQTVQRSGEQESVELFLAGQLVDSGATAQSVSSATVDKKKRSFDGQDCGFFCDYYYSDTTTHTTTVTTDWTGAFTISGTVSSQEILDKLLQDGALMVGLKVSGDLKLTGASLLLDYTKVDPAPVPEPSTILLSLIGLGGILHGRRRGKAARA